MKIACNIIARDAESTIRTCLDSILGIFDQVVVVIDTRTADRTADIVSSYSERYPEVELYFYEWVTQDWSKARNYALSKSKDADYIFWIDIDEYLYDRDCLLYLISILDNSSLLGETRNAFMMKEISPTEDGSVVEVDQIKLFPNVATWELPAHEQVIYSLEKKGVPIIPTNCTVIHSGYSNKDIVTQKHIRNYNSIVNGINDIKDGRKRKYLLDQKNKSDLYFSSNNIHGINFGMDPVTISLIASVVASLLKAGYSYYQSLQMAKQQLAIQEALNESQKSALAYSLFQANPTISYYMWYGFVDRTFSSSSSNLPPLTELPKSDNTWYYVIGAGLVIFALWRLK
jgi:hypothetical protein